MKAVFLIFLVLLTSFCSFEQNQEQVYSSKENGALHFTINNRSVLSYQYEEYESPAGIDPVYNRSGFIHPLKTLSGHTLTQIQPADHYHHYGVWNPWTRVEFEQDTLDFWNLDYKQGTVRFAGFKKEFQNGFSALHEHVVLKDGKNKVALNEIQTVSLHSLSDDQYAVDFKMEYACAGESPFKILEYRYAGFSIRPTEAWRAVNSEIISSEESVRDSIDGTRGKWCLIQGSFGEEYGAVLLMSNPDNFNHPEPLRVWPSSNHEGRIMVNFSPTKNRDWLLEPGNTYVLKYRIVVSDEKMTDQEANELWNNYIEIE